MHRQVDAGELVAELPFEGLLHVHTSGKVSSIVQ